MNTSNNQGIHESKKNRNLRLGQSNLHNSNRATNESGQVMLERRLDFFMIHEPYSINGQVKGFGLATTNQILSNQGQNNRPMAAIACKPDKEPLYLLRNSNAHLQYAKLR